MQMVGVIQAKILPMRIRRTELVGPSRVSPISWRASSPHMRGSRTRGQARPSCKVYRVSFELSMITGEKLSKFLSGNSSKFFTLCSVISLHPLLHRDRGSSLHHLLVWVETQQRRMELSVLLFNLPPELHPAMGKRLHIAKEKPA